MAEAFNSKRSPVLVVGIGNILLRDEGFGPCVIKALEGEKLPEYVELLDGGTAGADLVDFICDRQKVIIIDIIQADAEPGSIIRMSGEDLNSDTQQSISLHEFGLAETVMMTRQLRCAPQEVIIFGVKPVDISVGMGLSASIAALVPDIVNLVKNELEKMLYV